MTATRPLKRLSGEAETPKQPGEPYRIRVQFPNGDLAYQATRDQERELRAAGLVDEVRSPSGILRHLRLHRDHRLLHPDPMLRHVITRNHTDALTWAPRLDAAHTGKIGTSKTRHIQTSYETFGKSLPAAVEGARRIVT